MDLVDVSPQTSLIDTPQEEAVDNLVGANVYNLNPDSYKEHADILAPEIEKLDQPTEATPIVARNIASSSQHAAAIAPDVDKLSFIEKQWGNIKNAWNKTRGPEQELRDLAWKKLRSGDTGADQFTAEDNLQYLSLKDQQQSGYGMKDYGLTGFWENLPADIAGMAGGFLNTAQKNAGTIAAIAGAETAGGAGIGAAIGLGAGGVGAIPGATVGAGQGLRSGLTHGIMAATLMQGYKDSAAAVYSELDDAKDANGQPLNIDERNKAYLAHGVGAISGLIQVGTEKLLFDKIPLLKNLVSPTKAVPMLLNPENEALRQAFINIGQKTAGMTAKDFVKVLAGSTAVGGASGLAQEFANMLATTTGQTYKDQQLSFTNGMINLAKDIGSNTSPTGEPNAPGAATRLATSTVAGGVAGLGFGAAGMLASKAAETALPDKPIRNRAVRDVAPATPEFDQPQLTGAQEPGEIVVPPSDIIDPSGSPSAMVKEVTDFQQAVDATVQVGKETKLHKLDKNQVSLLREQMVQDAGVDSVWVDGDDLTKFAHGDEEKAKRVRDMIDPSGVAASQLKAPIRVRTSKLLDLADDYPEITGDVRLHPEGPSPNSAHAFVEELKAAEAKREELRTRLQVGEKSPEERAYALNITPDMPSEDLAKALGSKETAQAYLDRLDVEDVAAKGNKIDNTQAIAQAESTHQAKIFSSSLVDERLAKAEADLADFEKSQSSGAVSFQDVKESKDTNNAIRESLVKKVEEHKTEIADLEKQIADNKESKVSKLGLEENLQNKIEGLKTRIGYIEQRLAKKEITPTKEDIETNANYRRRSLQYSVEYEKNKKAEREASVLEAKKEIERLQAEHGTELTPESRADRQRIAALRERVQTMLPELPAHQTTQDIIRAALNTDSPQNDIFGYKGYLDQGTFNEDVESTMPEKEVAKFRKLEHDGKLDVLKNIQDTADWEMNKVANINEDILREIATEQEVERAGSDPNVQLVDRFAQGKDFVPTERRRTIDDLTASHAKKGYSPYAIDPRSLSESQANKYREDAVLKTNKVFVKGGISVNEAAELLGAGSGDNLLHILSTTPTSEQLVKNNLARRDAEIKRDARDGTSLHEVAVIKALNNKSKNDLAVMKFMIDKSYSTVGKQFVRVATPVPKIEKLRTEARDVVLQTKIQDLSVNQYKVGQRKAQKLAAQAYVKGDFLRSSNLKLAEARNTELTAATMTGIAEVNRAVRRIKKFATEERMRELREAGPEFESAAREVMDVYSFKKWEKGAKERGQFQKLVQKLVEEQKTDISIPEHLSSVKASYKEMTVEELTAIDTALTALYKQAQMVNRLYDEQEKLTFENVVTDLVQHLNSHPDSNESNAVEAKARTIGQKLAGVMRDGKAMLRDIAHIVEYIDNEEVGGKMANRIVAPLQGIGRFTNGGQAFKDRLQIQAKDQYEAAIKKYFAGDKWPLWRDLETTNVDIPEWRENKLLGNGNLAKSDLFVMGLHTGNSGNFDRLVKGYNTDREMVIKQINTHLDKSHGLMIQAIWDIFDQFYPEVEKLQLDTLGKKMERVLPEPVEMLGMTLKGGYFTMVSAPEQSLKKITRAGKNDLARVSGETESRIEQGFDVDDMTRHRHTENRTGSIEPLSLSMNSIGMSIEGIVHDLAFRRPIADTMKILLDPRVAHSIAKITGLQDYKVLLNSVADASNSIEMRNNALFDSGQMIKQLERRVYGVGATAVLAFNIKSIAIQPVSFLFTAQKAGPKSIPHLARALWLSRKNPSLWKDMEEFAGEIIHSIHSTSKNLDENRRDAISKLNPDNPITKHSPIARKELVATERMAESVKQVAFNILGTPDHEMKKIAALGLYSQFTSGDVAEYPIERLRKMTNEEIDHQAKLYAAHNAGLTLTATGNLDRAPIQKDDSYLRFTRYFNDTRNMNQNIWTMARQTNRKFKDEGYYKGTLYALSAIAVMVAARYYEDKLRNFGPPSMTPDPGESFPHFAGKWSMYLATTPADMLVSNSPVAREINYTFQTTTDHNRKYKHVQFADSQAADNIYKTVDIMYDFLDIYNHRRELTVQEKKALAYTFGYGTEITPPINALSKIYDGVNNPTFNSTPLRDMFLDSLKKAEKKNDQASGDEKMDPEILKSMQELRDVLENKSDPKREGASVDSIPPNTYDVIKQIESNGNAFAQNPNSTAAGLYQFTSDTWSTIKASAPQLHLTEAGRTSGNVEQQEKAMKWFTEQNVKKLKAADLEPSLENIYAAHFLGADSAIAVLSSSSPVKLKTLISKEAMTANNFRNNMKVKDFKAWIKNKVNGASTEVASIDN